MLTVGVVAGVLGAVLYCLSLLSRQWADHLLMECVAQVAYSRMLGGQEILLEDLEEIYKQETKEITGIEGVLTALEAHDLTGAILHLSQHQRTLPPWWESTVENLRRSLPLGGIFVGANVFRYIGPIAMLVLMIVVYGALGGKQVQHVTLYVAGLVLVSCCYLLPNFLYWRTVVRARRRLVELHVVPHAPTGTA